MVKGVMDIDSQIKALYELLKVSKRAELANILGVSSASIQNWRNRNKIPEHILLKAQQLSEMVKVSNQNFIELPFYDVVKGEISKLENKEQPITFSWMFVNHTLNVNESDIFQMTISDDSMAPTLKNKSIIVVNRMKTIVEDGVYVFSCNGLVRVKRLQIFNSGITVISDNPAYPAWEVSEAEWKMGNMKIIGKVICSVQAV